MEEKTIYNLKLHESLQVGTEFVIFVVIRVPGGWVYHSNNSDLFIFVPWDNEFQKLYKNDTIF